MPRAVGAHELDHPQRPVTDVLQVQLLVHLAPSSGVGLLALAHQPAGQGPAPVAVGVAHEQHLVVAQSTQRTPRTVGRRT